MRDGDKLEAAEIWNKASVQLQDLVVNNAEAVEAGEAVVVEDEPQEKVILGNTKLDIRDYPRRDLT